VLPAKQGDTDAQNNIALMYQNGWGVEPNRVEAIARWLKSAHQGNEVAKKICETWASTHERTHARIFVGGQPRIRIPPTPSLAWESVTFADEESRRTTSKRSNGFTAPPSKGTCEPGCDGLQRLWRPARLQGAFGWFDSPVLFR
jgi:TPR repeat protein